MAKEANSKNPVKAAKPLTTKQWNALRRKYISGDDSVTYQALSAEHAGVTLDMVKKRAIREEWSELRSQFRHQDSTRARELDLEVIEEVRKRHVALGKAMQGISMRRLMDIIKNPHAEITTYEAIALGRTGREIEAKARGMEELTVRLEDLRSPGDLKKLSSDQLLELLERRRAANAPAKA